MTAEVRIRRCGPEDAPVLLGLIRELAAYERLEQDVVGTAEMLALHLAGDPPLIEALLAEDGGGRSLGFTLVYTTFSTFLARPGLHIEDLYVVPTARGAGVGGALLAAVAAMAAERGAGRVEWDVLDWNEPAIGFYRRLGAAPVDGWTRYRLTAGAIARVAGAGPETRGQVAAEPLS
ncbi:MAG TPA: GNAT family N-acetyltransferase [Candidatus Dormibacteraeota bacterium]|nr:GNAT family N-acetyltransferase [Candidatus Dormibacteraeota bacterium]